MAFQSEWLDWLHVAQLSGAGGIVYPKSIVRGTAFTTDLYIEADYSADTFKAQIRSAPDADSIADLTETVSAYEADFAGYTTLTLSLTKAQVALIPADEDGNGVEEVLCDVLHTPAVGPQYRLLGFVIPVSGKVTEGD